MFDISKFGGKYYMGKNRVSVVTIYEIEEENKIDEKVKTCYEEIIKSAVDKFRESSGRKRKG